VRAKDAAVPRARTSTSEPTVISTEFTKYWKMPRSQAVTKLSGDSDVGSAQGLAKISVLVLNEEETIQNSGYSTPIAIAARSTHAAMRTTRADGLVALLRRRVSDTSRVGRDDGADGEAVVEVVTAKPSFDGSRASGLCPGPWSGRGPAWTSWRRSPCGR